MGLIRQSEIKFNLIIGILIASIAFTNLQYSITEESNYNSAIDGEYDSSRLTYSIGEVESNTVFLPHTNLTVQEYIWNPYNLKWENGNIFNTTILSLNKTHWDVRCDYSIPNDAGPPVAPEYESPFYPSVNRSSVSHFYHASPYFMWWGMRYNTFDFWINPSDFYDGYSFIIEESTFYVSYENFELENIGSFDAWKISVTVPDIGDIISRYSTDGLFLSQNFTYVTPFWYNLTLAEFASLPQDYIGPSMISLTPGNNTIRPNGTTIQIELDSPFKVNEVKYSWDEGENITSTSLITTTFPVGETDHHLMIFATDTLSITNTIHLTFITDDTYPAIELIKLENNSKIQGNKGVELDIKSGNGTFTYNWDSNEPLTVPEGTTIAAPMNEGLHVLNVSVQSVSQVKVSTLFVFIVDNTPPSFQIYGFQNNSVLKGKVIFQISVDEKTRLKSLLIETNDSREYIINMGINRTIQYLGLINGSYSLNLTLIDEANNTIISIYLFSIYTSSFNWNWELNAFTPRSIAFVDHQGEVWFYLTIASKIDQTFNFTIVHEEFLPQSVINLSYAVRFRCQQPDAIIFMTLALPINGSTSNFPVYHWIYWSEDQASWKDMETYFNEVEFVWEATYEGYAPYFVLIDTGELTKTKEVVPSGGQISSFEFPFVVISLAILSLIGTKKGKLLSRKII
ncbi:MAG: hypothetical protein EAX86_04335 [Candidatus Heimdallarchaeota archaeon]|nr:hypothetical protein [Candidatus Heimdallarchaeota archaeon]